MRLGLGLGIAAPAIWRRHNGGPVLDADAEAYITRAGITNPVYADAARAVVARLKEFGVFTKLDWLNAYPNESSTAALKNIVRDDFHSSLVNAPTFAAGQGITTSSGKYILVDYNPSIDAINFAQDTAAAFVWVETAVGNSGLNTVLGARQASPQRYIRISPYESNGAAVYFDMNNVNGITGTVVAQGNYIGFYAGLRTSSTAVSLRKNGSQLASMSFASSGVPNSQVAVGAARSSDGSAGEYWPGRISFAGMGNLSAAELDNVRIALGEYRTAVGL